MKINPNVLRNHILDMVYNKQSGHIGGSFSICEIIAYLYSNYDLINKDKLILSKGHGVPAIYAALYELGYIKNLDMFREINSPLQGHPDKNALSYIHATTGSLGQGLSISIGHALACKLLGIDKNIFCIVGDGELQEGQIWEALMLAPKLKLENLTCFVDYNNFQNDGELKIDLSNLIQHANLFGWDCYMINGNDIDQINGVMVSCDYVVKPSFVILRTIKGKGVSFMENNPIWHASVPNKEEYARAKKELML